MKKLLILLPLSVFAVGLEAGLGTVFSAVPCFVLLMLVTVYRGQLDRPTEIASIFAGILWDLALCHTLCLSPLAFLAFLFFEEKQRKKFDLTVPDRRFSCMMSLWSAMPILYAVLFLCAVKECGLHFSCFLSPFRTLIPTGILGSVLCLFRRKRERFY